jgi:hypothetical protein
VFDDCRAGSSWYTELTNIRKILSQFWKKIAPYHWFIIVKYWNWFHCLFSPNCHSPGFITMIGGYHSRNFFIAPFCHGNKSCMLRYDFAFLQFCIFHFQRHVFLIQLQNTGRWTKSENPACLSVRSPARAWKPVTEEEMYIVLGLFMLMGIVQKPTLRSYFTTKRLISTPGFRDIMTWDRREITCKFLHFTDNESNSNFGGPEKLFKIFLVISHLITNFRNCISQTRTFQLTNHWLFGKPNISHCSETGSTPVEKRPDCVDGQLLLARTLKIT